MDLVIRTKPTESSGKYSDNRLLVFRYDYSCSLAPWIRARDVQMESEFLPLQAPTKPLQAHRSMEAGSAPTFWTHFAHQDRTGSWSKTMTSALNAFDSREESLRTIRSTGRIESSSEYSLLTSDHESRIVKGVQSSTSPVGCGERRRIAGAQRKIARVHDPAFHLGRRICYDLGGLCTTEKESSMTILNEYFENFWLRYLADSLAVVQTWKL